MCVVRVFLLLLLSRNIRMNLFLVLDVYNDDTFSEWLLFYEEGTIEKKLSYGFDHDRLFF